MTIPNLITLLRFFLVPAVILSLLSGDYGWALTCFLVAGASDGIDGFIARTFDQKSELGAYLDPVADKLLLVSVFVVLGLGGVLPLWYVIAAVSRDGLIVGAVMLSTVMGNPVEIKPLLVSKANTAFQIAVAGAVLAQLAFAADFGGALTALILFSGFLTILSAGAYLIEWMRHMSSDGADNEKT
ncbi:MAG: CDP-alcohol phosphatidyltransferase family protein [Rhizobiaceae bacterium]